METKKTMLAVIDARGRIIAAAHKHTDSSTEINTALLPLPGQEIHEVEMPEEVFRLRSGHDFHMALTHAEFDRATHKLVFPKITFKKLKY